jgi:hypothetical protein
MQCVDGMAEAAAGINDTKRLCEQVRFLLSQLILFYSFFNLHNTISTLRRKRVSEQVRIATLRNVKPPVQVTLMQCNQTIFVCCAMQHYR